MISSKPRPDILGRMSSFFVVYAADDGISSIPGPGSSNCRIVRIVCTRSISFCASMPTLSLSVVQPAATALRALFQRYIRFIITPLFRTSQYKEGKYRLLIENNIGRMIIDSFGDILQRKEG